MMVLGALGSVTMTAGFIAAIFGFSGMGSVVLILLGAFIAIVAVLIPFHKRRRENRQRRSDQESQEEPPEYSAAMNEDRLVHVPSFPHQISRGSVEMPSLIPTLVNHSETDNPPSYEDLYGRTS